MRELLPGAVFGGRFTVRAALARHAWGASATALTVPNREVVLRVYRPEIVDAPGLADALAKLDAATRDLPRRFVLATEERGRDGATAFSVRAASAQPSLAELVQVCPLTPEEALFFLRALARSLDALHGAGITHGALRPTNVFVGPAPEWAVELSDAEATLLRRAAPPPPDEAAWLAPEVAAGAAPTPRADVLGMAHLAFFAMTGKPYGAVGAGPAGPAPSARARELGAPLVDLVDAALASAFSASPDARPASPAAFVETFARGLAKEAPRARADDPLPASTARMQAQDVGRLVREAIRSREASQEAAALAGAATESARLLAAPPRVPGPPSESDVAPSVVPPPPAELVAAQEAFEASGWPDPDGADGADAPSAPSAPSLAAVAPSLAVAPGPPPSAPALPPAAPSPSSPGPLGFPALPLSEPLPLGALPASLEPTVPTRVAAATNADLGARPRGARIAILAGLAAFVLASLVGVTAALLLRRRATETPARAEAVDPAATAPEPVPVASTPLPPVDPAPPTAPEEPTPAPAPEDAGAAATSTSLLVQCEPACETVLVDGKALADPLAATPIKPGSHGVGVSRAHYGGQWKSVSVAAGEAKVVAFKLTPKTKAPAAPKKPCGKFLKRCD